MEAMPVSWGNRFVLMALSVALLVMAGCGQLAKPSTENMPDSCDVIIIGKSVAALTAALEASRQGALVMVFSEGDYLEQWLLDEGAASTWDEAELAELKETPPNYNKAAPGLVRFGQGYRSGLVFQSDVSQFQFGLGLV